MLKIKIKDEYVTLGQLLKITDWIDSGGQAKSAVKTLNIMVNDIQENRRGRKLYPNDKIRIEDKEYEIQ